MGQRCGAYPDSDADRHPDANPEPNANGNADPFAESHTQSFAEGNGEKAYARHRDNFRYNVISVLRVKPLDVKFSTSNQPGLY